jgi:hypothetical protein
MAFDAETTERTVTRDRVLRLRDFLKALPDKKFDMRNPGICGSPACIGGWGLRLFMPDEADEASIRVVGPMLGLTDFQACELFFPGAAAAYSASPLQAVAVLDHLLATGEVDWSVAK